MRPLTNFDPKKEELFRKTIEIYNYRTFQAGKFIIKKEPFGFPNIASDYSLWTSGGDCGRFWAIFDTIVYMNGDKNPPKSTLKIGDNIVLKGSFGYVFSLKIKAHTNNFQCVSDGNRWYDISPEGSYKLLGKVETTP